MPTINRQALLFSLNCFAASLLALYIALALDLPRPYWSMLTVYITSTPMAGAVRSKAVFRLAGTLLGAVVAVVLVPNLVNDPAVLSLALGCWAAGCLAVSLLDRTPRSYALMLAGYTAALIGFPVVDHPEMVFDFAVSRVEEIGLGIVCAAMVHSLVFPAPAGEAIRTRLSQWLASADAWLLDLAEGTGDGSRDRRNLAAAAGEVRILATHLPFDTSRMRETSAAVQAMNERMLLLIPLLSGIEDRRQALQACGGVGVEASARLKETADWVRGGAGIESGQRLAEAIRASAEACTAGDWRALLTLALLRQLADAVPALAKCHALLAHMRDPDAPLPAPVAFALSTARARPLHRDWGLALRSGLTCLLAVLCACAFWIGTGWPEGATAAALAAVFCSLFAGLDDPAPTILSFGVVSVATLMLAAVYNFGILHAVDGFLQLALALLPPMLLFGLLMGNPSTAGKGMALSVTFASAIGVQSTVPTDFAAFLNGNLGVYAALLIAVGLTRTLRSMTAENFARRLRRHIRSGIARLVPGRLQAGEAVDTAALMIDRLALLTPRLAMQDSQGDALADESLRELRVTVNMLVLGEERSRMSDSERVQADRLMLEVADRYGRLAAGDTPPAPEALCARLDELLARLAHSGRSIERRALVALVGLRRNLFPLALAPENLEARP